ncbi:MAG: pyridoxamine 5'-phosphate oxidase family protein [Planctomycetota bacterium]|nr:pyridoxamine 5'-phosphate oxidase family protein [Planctomycetota bacterium]
MATKAKATRRDVLKLVKSCSFGFMSTCDKGQPRVRPMTPIVDDDFTFWICTGTNDRKMRQVKLNPRIELCYINDKCEHVRMAGPARVWTSLVTRRELYSRAKWLADHFKTPTDPRFGLLRFKPKKAEVMLAGKYEYDTVRI